MPNIKNLQDFLDAYSKEYPPLAIGCNFKRL